jgi:hypothetical protein
MCEAGGRRTSEQHGLVLPNDLLVTLLPVCRQTEVTDRRQSSERNKNHWCFVSSRRPGETQPQVAFHIRGDFARALPVPGLGHKLSLIWQEINQSKIDDESSECSLEQERLTILGDAVGPRVSLFLRHFSSGHIGAREATDCPNRRRPSFAGGLICSRSRNSTVRDRLCQLIRQHHLDANLVKSYAIDLCGSAEGRGQIFCFGINAFAP